MAKRRKSYRGTPGEHKRDAVESTRMMKGAAREMRSFLRAGNCYEALHSLRNAVASSGRALDASLYVRASQRRRLRRTGTNRLLDNLEGAFYRKCVKIPEPEVLKVGFGRRRK